MFEDEWRFSVVDVVGILSDSPDPRNYWKVLKHRLNKEGSEVVTKCNRLKLPASDGKYYLTDCVNTETLFRIIQSIPSKKAEPFKLGGTDQNKIIPMIRDLHAIFCKTGPGEEIILDVLLLDKCGLLLKVF